MVKMLLVLLNLNPSLKSLLSLFKNFTFRIDGAIGKNSRNIRNFSAYSDYLKLMKNKKRMFDVEKRDFFKLLFEVLPFEKLYHI